MYLIKSQNLSCNGEAFLKCSTLDAPTDVQEFVQRLWSCSGTLPKKAFKRGLFTFFRSGERRDISITNLLALNELLEQGIDNAQVFFHKKVLIGQSLFSSEPYSHKKRRFDSAVEFKNGTFGVVKDIVSVHQDCMCVDEKSCVCPLTLIILYTNLRKNSKAFHTNSKLRCLSAGVVHEVKLEAGLKATNASSLRRKCVLVTVAAVQYIVPLVNTVE